jgi:hypothetical protein
MKLYLSNISGTRRTCLVFTMLYISSDYLFKYFRPGVLKTFLGYHYMKFKISVHCKYFLV